MSLDSVLSHTRQIDGETLIFFTNQSHDEEASFSVSFPSPGALRRWNAETGEITGIASSSGAQARTDLRLPPFGSDVISWKPGADSVASPEPRLRETARDSRFGPWHIELTLPNSLTLDYCEYRIENGPWSATRYVRKAADAIHRYYGFRQAPCGHGIQPWAARERGLKAFPESARVALRFRFGVAILPGSPVSLALETPERFTVSLNGTSIPSKASGWFLDRSFHMLDISSAVRQGANEIVLEARMAEDLEIECLYVIGDFGMDAMSRHIIEPARALRLGDWTHQGLANYAGGVRYLETLDWPASTSERMFLELAGHRATAVAIHVNDALAGVLGWPPYTLELTPHLRAGANRVAIELSGSPHNLLGPHHFRPRGLPATHAGLFEVDDEKEYVLVPYGLSGPLHFVSKK